MSDGNSQLFDLAAILKAGDLDIRRVVRNNLSMKVGEYTALLAKYENDATKGMHALYSISDGEAKDSDIQTVTDIKDLMDTIGIYKIIPAIEDMLKANKRGHSAFASTSAKELILNYEKIHDKLKTAKTKAGGLPPAYYAAHTLKDAVQQIEQGESDRKLRILAVDDSPVMIKTITSVLEGEFKMYGMTNPTMMEKFLSQITPDLFLLDYEMPEMNGFELVPIIRNFKEHKDTPIIFLTSMGTMEHVSAAAKLGSSDFIVKPFQPDNLRDKVMKHIYRGNC